MSGAICPDCHCIAFDHSEVGTLCCAICGWAGPELNQPRRALDHDGWNRISARTAELRAAKAAGRWAMLRIRLKPGSPAARTQGCAQIARLFDLPAVDDPGAGDVVFSVEQTPGPETLAALAALPGVQGCAVNAMIA